MPVFQRLSALLYTLTKTWNDLPEDVTSSQSEYTFRRQLKTCMFKKSFPDIIIWYWLHLLTFSL